MAALEDDETCATLVRFGFSFCASDTDGRPDVRPTVFARELAVGARREDVRLRREGCSFVSVGFASALELVDAAVLVLAKLRRVPMEETAVLPDVTLVLVPIDETVLVRAVWREAAVPLPTSALLTRDRAVPTMLLGLEATVAVDLTVPEGAGALNEGIGDLEREVPDLVDVIVPAFFASTAEGGGLSSLFVCEPDAFLALDAEATEEAFDGARPRSAFAFSAFVLSAAAVTACCEAFGTGMLDGGGLTGAAALFALLPPPMFHTLRTSDFAAPKNPNLDFAFAAT